MALVNEIKKLSTDWRELLLDIDISSISEFYDKEVETFEPDIKILPPLESIFNCFSKFNKNNLKVVLLGQDPYINENEANGFCFSVNNDIKMPPSLRNIFKEIKEEFNVERNSKDLTDWAEQGVLLLNTALTVRQFNSNTHSKQWVNFTNKIIEYISDEMENIVFILWGNDAKKRKKFINEKKHFILESVHPSPLSASRGFFGNNHFIKVNEYLEKIGKSSIKWV